MNVKQIFIFSIFVDIAVLVASFLFKDNLFLLNTQVAYISFTFVIFATYITYKQSILKNAKIYSQSIQEDKENKENKEDIDEDESDKEVKQIFQAKNFLSYISVYRLISYLALSYSILYMINSNLFDAIGYIVGVSVTPITILILFILKKVS